MQLDMSELRKGSKIVWEGDPCVITEYQFVKPGKGTALYKCKVKNMVTGAQWAKTWRSGDKVEKADLEEKKMQYLYQDGDGYHFMNNETYDQVALSAEQVDDAANFMYENINVDMLFFNGNPIGLTLPNFVELQIVQSAPGAKGDTATKTTRPATLSTGYVVQIPLFVDEGEWIKIDTRTGEYSERVKK
ncbi:MAG: elongation factor P [Deltaproteobacteria bacterium]|nr:elongation factor P [Deltaproteobacteria bacterium]